MSTLQTEITISTMAPIDAAHVTEIYTKSFKRKLTAHPGSQIVQTFILYFYATEYNKMTKTKRCHCVTLLTYCP